METVIIKQSKSMNLLFFIVSAMPIYGAVRFVCCGSLTEDLNSREKLLVLGLTPVLGLLSVCGVAKRKVLVISDDGVKCGRSMLIPWEAIQYVSPVSFFGAQLVGFKLKPGKDFIAPGWIRWFVRHIHWPPRKDNDFTIELDGLTKTPGEIILLIEERMSKERNG